MTGSLSQSYFIFDAQQFKVGRKIYYGIDMNEEPNDDLNDLEKPKSSKSSESSSFSGEE